MGSKGSQQKTESTSTATSAPNAQAGALYGDILNQLQGYVQQNPNAPVYQGERVAQFTPDQLAAMGTVNQAQGAYQPYMQQAGQFAQQAGSAITPGQINAAMNPYQQQVIDATMAQMGQKNAQQMSALKGTEAQQGAFGGSRAAVTEANLGGQQNMNMASTLAGLNNQNYTQAVAQAQANRAAAGTGAQLESGLGTQSMQLPMYGAQQQAQQGALQQRLAQQNLDVPYQNFLQQQAWTPQMLQFEAGLGTGVGSQMGGTTTNTGQTTTTPAQPNPWMQAAGLGLSAAMAFSDKRAKENIEPVGHLNDGQKIYKYNYKGDPHTQIGLIAQEVERKHPEAVGESNGLKTVNYDLATRNAVHKADGGSVGSDIVGNAVRMARQMREGMAGGGVPGAGVGTGEYMGHSIPAIIPTSQMAMGKGAPSTPGFVSSPEMKNPNADMKGMGSSLGTLAKAGYDKWNEPMDISTPAQGAYTPMAVGDISSGTIGGTGLLGSGGVYSLGGTVSPESAYHGFAHRAYGGRDVVFDPTPISEQGGEDPNKAPVMPAEGFTDQPPSIVPAGEFKPYEAPPQADVPMPRPRPESLRVDNRAAAPTPIGADGTASAPVAPPTGGIFPRVLRTESTGRQLDENGNPLTSPKGAIGIAQIMPKTGPEAAKLAGLPWDEQKFKYDANYNATLGKAYFDHQTKVFGGDPEKGAAAYNAGPTKLREALAMAAAHGGSYKDYLPAETQSYLGKLFGQKQAGLGEPANGGPQAFSGDTRQDILAKYAETPIEVRGEPEQGGLELPFSQGDGGDHTNPAIDVAAQAIVPKNDDPRKLPQNLSILERVLGKEFDPATRQAIMAAGLRMMTTPGNIGTVLGTAGMQGMATYSEAKQLEQAQIEAQRKQAFEQEKFDRPYRELTAQQKAAQIEKRDEIKTKAEARKKLLDDNKISPTDPRYNHFLLTGEFPASLLGLTPAQKAIDTAFAKDYNDFVVKGGQASVISNLSKLDSIIRDLEKGDSIYSGPLISALPESVLAKTNPKVIDTRDRVAGIVQQNLRAVLGGQFAQREGEDLIKRAYDIRMDEKTNSLRLRALVQATQEALDEKQRAIKYFETEGKGSLQGFKANLVSTADIERRMDAIVQDIQGKKPSLRTLNPKNPAAPAAAEPGAANPAAPPAAGSAADIVPPSLRGRGNLQRNGEGLFRDKTTGEVFDKFGKPINPTKLLGENNG